MAFALIPATASPNHDSARWQRLKEVQYIEESNGISPAAVAGITALLAQLETQPTLPSLVVSIVDDVSGYNCTMTCRNGVWDSYDLTHPFLDDSSTVVRGPSVHTAIEQKITPADANSQRSDATTIAASTHGDPASNAGTSAASTTATTFQHLEGSSSVSSARRQSEQSSAPPFARSVPAPDMSH